MIVFFKVDFYGSILKKGVEYHKELCAAFKLNNESLESFMRIGELGIEAFGQHLQR